MSNNQNSASFKHWENVLTFSIKSLFCNKHYENLTCQTKAETFGLAALGVESWSLVGLKDVSIGDPNSQTADKEDGEVLHTRKD